MERHPLLLQGLLLPASDERLGSVEHAELSMLVGSRESP